MLPLILTLLLRLDAHPLKLNKQYLFDKAQNLSFHCGADSHHKTQILVHSDTQCTLEGQNIVQMGSEDQLSLYLSKECLNQMSIKCEGEFSIVQQCYIPTELIMAYNYKDSPSFQGTLIDSFTFSIDRECLIIIELQNYLYLIDSFRLILIQQIRDSQVEQIIEQADINTYFRLLSVGQYELIIIGPLIYRIYFQKDLVSQHFIFSESKMLDYTNITLLKAENIINDVYFILQSGECEIITSYNNAFLLEQPLNIELQQNYIYLFRFELLQILVKSNPLIIFIVKAHETLIFYPTTLIIVNHLDTLQPIMIWSHNNIRLQCNESIQIMYQQQQSIYYNVIQLFNCGIFKLQIYINILQISWLDIVYLRIHKNSTVTCICDSNQYSFKKISGQFNHYYKNQQLTISAQTFTTLIFRKASTTCIELKLNIIYKFQSTTKFRVYSPQAAIIKVRTYPEIQISAYEDHSQRVYSLISEQRIKYPNRVFYSYIIAISDHPFYIIIFDQVGKIINIPKVLFRLDELVFLNTNTTESTQLLLTQNPKYLTEIDIEILEHVNFNQKIYLACVIHYSERKYIQVYINEPYTIQQQEHYVIYLQQNEIIILLQQGEFLELQFKINTTDVEQVLTKYQDLSENQNLIFENQFSLKIVDYSVLNLSFFQCKQLDCILEFSASNIVTQQTISLISCVNIDFDLFELKMHLFFCQSLYNIQILRIKGVIDIDKPNNLINCRSDNCLILLENPIQYTSNLEDYKFEEILQLNQIHRNLNIQEFIFYNKASQIIRIHSDQQFTITSSVDDTEFKAKNMIFLEQGYYYLNFQLQVEYISVFTYPTVIQTDILYSFVNNEDFTIQNMQMKYIILEFHDYNDVTIFYNNQDFSIKQNRFYFENPINDNIVTFKGSGSFKMFNLEQICYLIIEPKVRVYNNKIQIELQLNKDCQYQLISVKFNEYTINSTIQAITFLIDEVQNSTQNYFNCNILGKTFNYIVITEDYKYDFRCHGSAQLIIDRPLFIEQFMLLVTLITFYNIIRLQRKDLIHNHQISKNYDLQQ